MIRIAIVAFFAAVLLMGGSPERSLDFLTTPDGEEYALAGYGLATHGRYEIVIDGRAHPPRYPPGYPLLIATFGHLRGHPELHDGVFVTWFCGGLCVLFAFLLGRCLGGAVPAVAAWSVALSMTLSWYARTILAEVPLACLHLAVAWLFLSWVQNGQRGLVRLLLAGVLIGYAATMRQTAFFLAVPFGLAWLFKQGLAAEGRRSRAALPLVALGPLGALAFYAVDGARRFGAPFRGGYQYWCSNPYDRLDRTFDAEFLIDQEHLLNLLRALHFQLGDVAAIGGRPWLEWATVAFLGVAFWGGLLHLWRQRGSRPLASFVTTVLALDLTFFGLYFYYEDRFLIALLPLHLVVAAVGLAGFARGLRKRIPSQAGFVLLFLLALVPLAQKACFFNDHLRRRYGGESELALMLAEVDATIEDDAVIVSNLSAPVVAHFLQRRDPERRYVPLFEDTEYRSKVATPEPPPDPDRLPEGRPTLHRYPGAEENGGIAVLPWSAESESERIVAFHTAGRAVYVLVNSEGRLRLGGALPARLDSVLNTRNLELLRIR